MWRIIRLPVSSLAAESFSKYNYVAEKNVHFSLLENMTALRSIYVIYDFLIF